MGWGEGHGVERRPASKESPASIPTPTTPRASGLLKVAGLLMYKVLSKERVPLLQVQRKVWESSH